MDAALATKTEIPGAGSRERKTRVFISYSRKDSAFSNRLVDALNARGFEAYLDKKDILPGEPWKERLDALILSADAIGVVISPDSIASQVCAWEVERAESLQKKMLPLVHRPVADTDLPPRLAFSAAPIRCCWASLLACICFFPQPIFLVLNANQVTLNMMAVTCPVILMF